MSDYPYRPFGGSPEYARKQTSALRDLLTPEQLQGLKDSNYRKGYEDAQRPVSYTHLTLPTKA